MLLDTYCFVCLFFFSYLSNTPTNLCMALLTFSLFCFVLYCYAFVQYCNVNTIQYNAMHKFVRVLDNPLFFHTEICPNFCSMIYPDTMLHWILYSIIVCRKLLQKVIKNILEMWLFSVSHTSLKLKLINLCMISWHYAVHIQIPEASLVSCCLLGLDYLAFPPHTKSFLNSNQVRNMVDKELTLWMCQVQKSYIF